MVFLLRQLLTGQHAGMNVAPALRDVGKDLVMRPANELCVLGETVINDESTRDGEVAHLAIEHSNRCRRVLDEHRQLRLSFCEVRFSPLAFADIDKHVDGTGQSSGLIEQRCRIGDERNPRAVGALGYRFHATDRSPLTAVPMPSGTRHAAAACHPASRVSRNRRTCSRQARGGSPKARPQPRCKR